MPFELRTRVSSKIVPKGASADEHIRLAARELATAVWLLCRSGEKPLKGIPQWRKWGKDAPEGIDPASLIDFGGWPLDLKVFVKENQFRQWEDAMRDDAPPLPAGFALDRQGYHAPGGGLVQDVSVTRAGRLASSTLVGLLRSRAYAYQREHGGTLADAVYSVRLLPSDIGAENGKEVSPRTATATTAEIRKILVPDYSPPESSTEALRRIAMEVLRSGASPAFRDAPEEAARILAETGLPAESQAATWRSRLTEARKRLGRG